jgi:hypothetical protein
MNTFVVDEHCWNVSCVVKDSYPLFCLFSLHLDNTLCRAVCDCLSELKLADVCDVMLLVCVGSLWKCEYESDLAMF